MNHLDLQFTLVSQRVDSYDVLVLHLHGQKHWTVCHPLNSSAEWAHASPAQLAQLFEIQRKNANGQANASSAFSWARAWKAYR